MTHKETDHHMNDNISEVRPSADSPSLEIAKYITAVLDAKKARDIRVLHVEDQTSLTDYFVIASGTSRTQLRALADEVDFRLEGTGITAFHTEGYDTGTWVLKDYGTVILHLFNSEMRDFYKLEKLYAGTTEVRTEDPAGADADE